MTYKFKKTDDNRWGIYLKDELLATVGSYQLRNSIERFLNKYIAEQAQ